METASDLMDFMKLKYDWFLKLRFESRMLARS